MSRARRARDIDAAVSAMSTEQLYCRDFGHSWAPFTAHEIRGGGFQEILRCQRCTTQRKRLLDRRGEVITSGYDYVDGYLIPGLGRMTGTDRGALRIAAIHHMIDTHPGAVTDVA